jgi:hypothetical protein
MHQLQSQANKLSKQVGREVEVTGKPAVRTVGTTVQGTASTVREEPVFKVSSVKRVADTCTAPAHLASNRFRLVLPIGRELVRCAFVRRAL